MEITGISKIKFEVLLKKISNIIFVIFQNFILTLSNRLDNTNQQLVESQHEVETLRSGAPIPS